MTRLKPGEVKAFKRCVFGGLQVKAECVDSDTPVIHLIQGDTQLELTDCEAHYLLEVLPKALGILPTSK